MTIMHAIAISLALGAAGVSAQAAPQATSTPGTASVQMQHIRNATTKIDYAGKTFLIDPFLAKKDTYPGFEGTFRSHLRNPTVELPMSVEDVMKSRRLERLCQHAGEPTHALYVVPESHVLVRAVLIVISIDEWDDREWHVQGANCHARGYCAAHHPDLHRILAIGVYEATA
jgi:hypothetical protein